MYFFNIVRDNRRPRSFEGVESAARCGGRSTARLTVTRADPAPAGLVCACCRATETIIQPAMIGIRSADSGDFVAIDDNDSPTGDVGASALRSRPAARLAYALALSTDDYLTAVLQMQRRLLWLGSRHPVVVFASPQVSDAALQQLKKMGVETRRLDESVDPGAGTQAANRAAGMGHWQHTFDKLRLFDQTEFAKLVYLDSDMLVLSAPDELFDRPHMSAVASGRTLRPHWRDLNSGVLVIEPGVFSSAQLLTHLDATRERLRLRGAAAGVGDGVDGGASGGVDGGVAGGPFGGVAGGADGEVTGFGDQDVLHTACPDWPERPELHLDEQFNLFFADLEACIRSGRYTLDQQSLDCRPVRIVHFAGPRKPWTRRYWLRDFARALNPLHPSPARARVLWQFRRSYREAAGALK